MSDVTPKTESRPVADEVTRKLTVLTGASEARILIDQVRREAASQAVAEILDRLERAAFGWAPVEALRRIDDFIASERKP